MDGGKPQRHSAYWDVIALARPRAVFAAPILAVGTLAAIATLAPAPLILPIIGIICLITAAATALFAWRTGARRHSETVTVWDVAGALAFVGFAAAMLSKPENVLYAFAGATAG